MGNFKLFGMDLGFLTAPTKRIIGCDNIHNRLYSLDGGAKTATGKFMSRFVQMVHRGLTFGGGKLGVLLFIAPAFVETAINVHKAEPNEKIGTGVNNLVGHISWVFTFPLALQIMHHICGAQYAGMTTDQVKQLRKLQTDFNDKNKLNGKPEGGGFKDHAEYNEARIDTNKKMKALKKVEGQKWYTKCVRKLANIITPDLGKLDAYNPGNAVGKKFFQMRNLPRNLWGVPVRLVIFGLLTMGVLDTAINKTLKLFFGGSYDSMKEEEIKDAKREQKKFLKEDLTDRLYDTQRKKIAETAINSKKANSNQKPQFSNGMIAHRGAEKNYMQPRQQNGGYSFATQPRPIPVINSRKSIDNYSYIPSQENIIPSPKAKGKLDNYSYIPSQNSEVQTKDGSTSNIRTYIPSQAAANIQKAWDNSGLQSALDRADRAEKRAQQILSNNFEGMP